MLIFQPLAELYGWDLNTMLKHTRIQLYFFSKEPPIATAKTEKDFMRMLGRAGRPNNSY
jgi:uncharacterized protein (DUF2132 family)